MTAQPSLLEEVLEAWRDTRLGVVEELAGIPARSYAFRPVAAVRSVHELGIHILEVAMMATGELGREDTNFNRLPWPRLLRKYAAEAHSIKTKSELLRRLRVQLRQATRQFRELGELHMLQLIERFDGQLGTRLAWLHHAIAQEEYHRGQLALYQRLLGLEPALTRRIRSG